MKSDSHRPEDTLRLPALDVLRGVAILGVIWHHLFIGRYPSGWWIESNVGGAFIGTWASNGWLGVSLFFILSGFVLYWPFATGKRGFGRWSDVTEFYQRRGKRLLPLYFFGVFILLGLSARQDVVSVAMLLTFTFNFHKETYFPGVNWVLWSLGLEFWFSLLFPLLVVAILRFGLAKTALAVFAVSLSTRMLGLHWPQADYMGNPSLNIIANSVLGRLDDFFVGMVLAALHAQGRRIAAPRLMLVLGLAAMTLTGVFNDLVLAGTIGKFGLLVMANLFQASAALVIMAALALRNFRFYPLELLGLMCYSLYFWHGVVMNHTAPGPEPKGLMNFALILSFIAWFSYRYIEHGTVRDWTRLLPRRQ